MPRVDGFEAAPLLLARRPGAEDHPVQRPGSTTTCAARAAAAGIRAVVSKDDFDELPRRVLRGRGPGGLSARSAAIAPRGGR